jgi:riboflavin kinase/FMN adenylyltransferase
MKVYRNLDLLPSFVNPVVTIGTFDGVHLGHQQILSHLKNEALAIHGETVVITFHPHPRNIVGDTTGVQLLTTLEEKIELLEAAKINYLVVVPFDDFFANQSAEEYVVNFLHQKFKPHTFIIGYDHRFGNKRSGDYQLLEKLGKQLGFIVKEIPQQLLNNATISSTQIRKSLLQADLKTATALLGYSYFFSGIVIRGDQIGRTIGYPTANLQLLTNEKLVPGDGVYAVLIKIKQNTNSQENVLKGMMYIGSRPVVNGKRRVIEVNIFDFNQDIYDSEVQITLHQWIRGDVHFNGLDALKNQLAIDQIHSLEALSVLG